MLSCMDNVAHCKYFKVPQEVDFEGRASWRNLGENANEPLYMFKTSLHVKKGMLGCLNRLS